MFIGHFYLGTYSLHIKTCWYWSSVWFLERRNRRVTRFTSECSADIFRRGKILSLLNHFTVLITLWKNGLKVLIIRLSSLNISETLVISFHVLLASLKVIFIIILLCKTWWLFLSLWNLNYLISFKKQSKMNHIQFW